MENDAFLNFVMNQEKPIDTTFKNFIDSKSMSKEIFMYGLCKVHKQEVVGWGGGGGGGGGGGPPPPPPPLFLPILLVLTARPCITYVLLRHRLSFYKHSS